MNDLEMVNLFLPLWEGSIDITTEKPLLAHYTTVTVLEKIFSTNQIWFSNPLLMNDMQEVRFGIIEGTQLVLNNLNNNEFIQACGGEERVRIFQHYFNYYNNLFQNDHVFDLYVLCLSVYDEQKSEDGLLSMWRGYGGNGMGAAIIFDASKIEIIAGSPLVIGAVVYENDDKRREWLRAMFSTFADILAKSDIPNEKLYIPAHVLFERIKLMALFSKHKGFSEEQEWRIVYLKDRDRENLLADKLSYMVGSSGIEPKLKFPIEPIPKLTGGDISLESLTYRILLGPSLSSPFAVAGIGRMLEQVDRPQLKERIKVCQIPYRPNL